MSAPRLLRDIHRSPPDAELRIVYRAYLECCEVRGWPIGTWCNGLRQFLVPLKLEHLLFDWADAASPREIAERVETSC
jgi:hypothetical protein